MSPMLSRRSVLSGTGAFAASARLARAAGPITIGGSLSLTGQLAAASRAIQLSLNLFGDDVNAKGGIAGRPVKFIIHDDQSDPANVPQIYAQLMDVNNVDLLISNGTNLTAPAIPLVIQSNRTLLAMFALAVNNRFRYQRYFQATPYGPDGESSISAGFFEALKGLAPKPTTIALAGADADFSNTAVAGARAHAKKMGLGIVYDRTYPPSTVDYTATVRGIAAAKPDVVFVGSYPLDTVGMIRAAHELKLKSLVFGGSMVGTQIGSLKIRLGPELNRIISSELYIPAVAKFFPDVEPFLRRYRPLAVRAGVDPLGYCMPPFAYGSMQILQQAVQAVGLDSAKLADYMHQATFKTMVGDIAFGPDGEWRKPRILTTQFQGIAGNALTQFEDPNKEVVLDPPEYKTGTVQVPFAMT